MFSIKQLNVRAIMSYAGEAALLLIDLVLAHGTFERVLDDSQLAFAVAALVAAVIFMAGHIAGNALFKGEHTTAGVALAAGAAAVIGVGVVRALFGLGGAGAASTGIAAAIGTDSSNQNSDLVMAVIVTILMAGVLAIGTWASRELVERRANHLASQVAITAHRAFDLSREEEFLANDLAAARDTLRTAIEDIAAHVLASSIAQAVDPDAADAMVDTLPMGHVLSDPWDASLDAPQAIASRDAAADRREHRGALSDLETFGLGKADDREVSSYVSAPRRATSAAA